jgi:RNA polymerase sigma-70 factor, ECF subfamily
VTEQTRQDVIDQICRYRRQIEGVCQRVLFNYGLALDAEDVAAEAIETAVRKIDTFREGAKPYTWLCTIAINKCIDHTRRNKRIPRGSVEIERMLAAHEKETGFTTSYDPFICPNPEPIYLQQMELRNVFERVLSQLNPSNRHLVLMLKEGRQCKEIAQALQVPEGTAKSRIFRLRKIFREELERTRGRIPN